MKNNSNILIKSYKLKHKTNPQKLDLIFDLYQVYKKEIKNNVFNYWSLFNTNQIPYFNGKIKFSHFGSTKHIQTQLNASYLQICLNESCGILNKYLASVELKFNDILNKSSIKDKDLLHQLRSINAQHAWLTNNHANNSPDYYPNLCIMDNYGYLVQSFLKVKTPVSTESLRLSKRIYNHIVRSRVKFPYLGKPRLILDSRVVEIQESKTENFDYWLNISTLESYKKILIPVKSNDFYEHSNGILGKTIELNFNDFNYKIKQHKHNSLTHKSSKNNKNSGQFHQVHRTMDVILNKKTEIKSEFINVNNNLLTENISFDLGLCNFIATSTGELHGTYWLDKLKIYDKRINTLLADRQYIFRHSKDKKNKIRSKRYDSLLSSLRGFIKSNINRILNNYFERNKNIKTVVIESLNFNKPELSRKLNRIIKNFGLKIFNDKLNELSLIKGFKVEELNPAYSSQECNECHYVDEKNRKTQSEFKCLCCGKELNADIQGANALLKRFQSKQSKSYKTLNKSIILGLLKSNFVNGIKNLLSKGIISRRELLNLILKNKYFKDIYNESNNLKGLVKTTEASGIKPMTAKYCNEILNKLIESYENSKIKTTA